MDCINQYYLKPEKKDLSLLDLISPIQNQEFRL